MRPEIQVARVDFELRMAMIPGKLHDAVSVDLLVYSNLLAITNLTVAQTLRRLVHATFSRVNLADDEDSDLVRPDGVRNACLIDLTGQNSDDLMF